MFLNRPPILLITRNEIELKALEIESIFSFSFIVEAFSNKMILFVTLGSKQFSFPLKREQIRLRALKDSLPPPCDSLLLTARIENNFPCDFSRNREELISVEMLRSR